jgi:hypothetical protein
MVDSIRVNPDNVFDVPLEMEGREWHAPAFGKINRKGIPNVVGGKFEEINDIDYICDNLLGGIIIAKEREPFMTNGNPWERAMTAYHIGNSIVVNRSWGYHPDRKTTVLTKVGEEPEKRILDRFGEYYYGEPRIVKAQIDVGISLD